MRFSFAAIPKHRFVAVALGLLTIAAFCRVSQNGFVGYDDPDYLTLNPIVRQGLTHEGLAWAFGKVHGEQTYWHPLTWVSHMLDVQLFGMNAAAHHLVSLAFHTANTVLLFLLLHMMTGSLWRSAMVAALFGIHPLQVESVAWATERKNVLSTLFGMLTLLAYVRYARPAGPERAQNTQKKNLNPAPKGAEGGTITGRPTARRWYALSIVFFALCLMCKPALVPLPGVLLLLDFWPLARLKVQSLTSKIQSSKASSPLLDRRILLEKIPFFLLSIASSVITMMAHQGLGMLSEAAAVRKSLQWANVFLSYVKYVGNAIFPIKLAAFYPFPESIDGGVVTLCVLFLLAVSAFVIAQRKKRPYLLVGWLWFLGMLVPTIGVVHVGIQAMADRFAYVAVIGLFLGVVWRVAEMLEQRAVGKTMRAGLAAIVIVALTAVSWRQIGFWKNDYTLFERARTVTQRNFMAYTAVGGVLLKQGQFGQAMEYFQIAREFDPAFADVYFSIGLAMSMKDRVAEAITNFQEAVRLKPFYPEAQLNLALMLQTAGRLDESIATYEQILKVQPYSDQGHLGIGNALMTRGRFDDAIRHFREAIRLNPQASAAMARLAWILATHPDPKIRNGNEAVRLAEQSCKLSHYRHTQTVSTLVAAYAEKGEFDLAVRTADQALELARTNNESYLIPLIENLRESSRKHQPHRENLQ